jgi:uncharacterized lipoprotein YbaY
MNVLKGLIFCKSDEHLPKNSSVKICLLECSKKDGSSKVIKQVELMSPQAFPIEYSIEFNSDLIDLSNSIYYLQVSIQVNNMIRFSNLNINKNKNDHGDFIARYAKIRRHLDVYLNHFDN